MRFLSSNKWSTIFTCSAKFGIWETEHSIGPQFQLEDSRFLQSSKMEFSQVHNLLSNIDCLYSLMHKPEVQGECPPGERRDIEPSHIRRLKRKRFLVILWGTFRESRDAIISFESIKEESRLLGKRAFWVFCLRISKLSKSKGIWLLFRVSTQKVFRNSLFPSHTWAYFHV